MIDTTFLQGNTLVQTPSWSDLLSGSIGAGLVVLFQSAAGFIKARQEMKSAEIAQEAAQEERQYLGHKRWAELDLQVQDSISKWIDRLDERIRDLEKERDELGQMRKALLSRIHELEDQNEELNIQLTVSLRALERVEGAYAQAKKEIEGLRDGLLEVAKNGSA